MTTRQKLLGGTAFSRFAKFTKWHPIRLNFMFGIVSLHLWPRGGPFPPEHKEMRDHALRIAKTSVRRNKVRDVQPAVGR